MPEQASFQADSAQLEAIRHITGPCRVLAGPGSGKTHVMIRRIQYLIENAGVSPSQILAVTFSRAAALQMQARFSALSREHAAFSTLHAFCYRILSEESGFQYKVIRPDEKAALIRRLIGDYCSASEQSFPDLEQELAFQIARRKESTLEPAWLPVSAEAFRKVCAGYDQWLAENSRIDFSDMILKAYALLEKQPSILSRWQERFTYYLIDEFQDLSDSQYALVRLLAGKSRNIYVVGDDDQSIYAFRGASPSIFQRFHQDFPDCAQIHLNVNYRCAETIRQAADRVISCNTERIFKKSFSVIKGGRCELMSFISEKEELACLIRELRSLNRNQLNHTAVIVRTRVLTEYFRRSLSENGIPCRGSRRPDAGLDKAFLEDLISYFRLACECSSGGGQRRDFYRIMNRPERYLTRDLAPGDRVTAASVLQRAGSRAATKLKAEELFRDLNCLRTMRPSSGLRYLLKAMGYQQFMENKAGRMNPPGEAGIEALMREAAACARTQDFVHRLEQLLAVPQQTVREENTAEGVHVLTMHASKGLEYDRVYLPELNEGIIPGRKTASTKTGEEEERRLFYVAMTRARKELHLFYLSGTPQNPRTASRFLSPLLHR